ncbi:MAG: hypothetical protein IPP19_11455 [Verrucomicrobia bacterium]|nr:hypothetical protein [Verrucomicrobiota bacterium]
MSEVTALIEPHPAGEAPTRFRFECTGGTVAVTTSTDRLTAYGGAAARSHYLEKLGLADGFGAAFP